MSRRFAIVCLVLLALSPAAAMAQDEEPETGSVSGQVTNGTEDGGDVEGLEVVLTRFQQMDAVETFTTEVASDGTYEFSDLPILDNEAFLVEVFYEGIEFTSGMILLSQEPETERDITVYEQTNDPSVLRLVSRGIVIADADEEAAIVEILEIIALANDSDRVFVGDENGEVLRLAVPENANQVAPQPGFDFGQMSFADDEDTVLVSTGPVDPGSHNPMISYQIPYEGTSAELSVGTAMATETLRVLVQEDSFDISSEILEPAGVQQIGNENTYEVLAIDRPVVGDSFGVEISGLPRENWNLPVAMSTFLASIAAGVGLVIGAVLIYQVVQRRQKSTAGGPVAEDGNDSVEEPDADELERKRLELASELNKLEADYERGDIDEESYNTERDQILAELRQISLRMRGIDE
ncbi:MAG: hypothetical protein WD401_02295 [Thermomicrobiaceae bacterium]